MPEFEPIEEPTEGEGGGIYVHHLSRWDNVPDWLQVVLVILGVCAIIYRVYKYLDKCAAVDNKTLTDYKATHTRSRTAYSSLA